ncbi:MAG: histidine phosphatase family protein, partial [Pseudomonadota bacterium]
MQTLYIVRHGNTFDTGDTVLRVGGRTDLPLSTSGEMQATALGIHFA